MVYFKSPEHPGESLRARHIDFLQVNFPGLAELAYKGYLEKGRGMVVIDEASFMNPPPGVLAEIKIAYISADDENFTKLGVDWPGDKEAEWVRSYNPKTTVLFSFSRCDGGVSSYLLTAPVEAWWPVRLYEARKK